MSLRDSIYEIDELLKKSAYALSPKISRYYQIKDAINSIVDDLNGGIYDYYQDYQQGAAVRALLSNGNKNKYVKNKYHWGKELERHTKTRLQQLWLYIHGNTCKGEKVRYLFVTVDDPDRNNWWQLLLGKRELKPRRLLAAPFFCLFHRAKRIDLFQELKKR